MKKYICIVALFFTNIILAQQAEVAVSKRVDIDVITDKEIDYYESLESNSGHRNSRGSDVYRKEREFLIKFKNQISTSYDEIVTRLGINSDIRFVKEYNPLTTNFILRIRFVAMFQEIPFDVNVEGQTEKGGEFTHGVYYIRTIFLLEDPHTGTVVTMFPMHQAKYTTGSHLSADYVFREYWELFLNVAVPRASAKELKGLIKSKVSYSKVKIKYKPNNKGEKAKADGKQKGKISLTNIIGIVIGEAKNNSITKFKLTCEKGTFLETNSKEIEFTGADYYHSGFGGSNKYETPYKTYSCNDFEEEEKEQDIFTLIQLQCLSDEMEMEIKKEKIDFKCEETYDIFLTYTAPGFAKAKLVWENTKIRFPEDGEKLQFFDMMSYRSSGASDHPRGTDGKPLEIPYTTIIPGIGKQTLYGWPESDTATPEVISISSLGGNGVFTKFKINLSEESLNSCNISQIGTGSIYLELGFDLTGKYPNDDVWQQVDVTCWEDKVLGITKSGTFSPYPVDFKQHKFSKGEIEKFKQNKEFDIILSNGKATLKIEFKISGE